ncbi:MAG TPA: hypothetical protein VKR58_00130 [Aquella sp.]|nr:hypothetical protein [Aquella sp.]
MSKQIDYKKIRVPILTGSYFDLQKFNLSFKDIQILDIKSRAFDSYIKKLNPDSILYLNKIKKQTSKYDKKYAIVKIHPEKNFDYTELVNVWKILLIIFPSDLQIQHVIDYSLVDNHYEFVSLSSWPKNVTEQYPGNPLYTKDTEIAGINEFIKIVFDRLKCDNYIGIAIENYITSFSSSHLHYQYLTLFMALESIVHGPHELTYRLKRSAAILCGEDPFNCEIIFDKINTLYELRSKIIHGENYSVSKVKEYLPYLEAIASRVIIELLIHNIANIKDLNNTITRIGYGDRSKISQNWKAFQLNILTLSHANWIRVKKKS